MTQKISGKPMKTLQYSEVLFPLMSLGSGRPVLAIIVVNDTTPSERNDIITIVVAKR